MSTTPNAYGNFLSNPPPFLSNYAAVASPWGTFVKPGGRVAAYVRSTGAQDGEDHFASSGLLVASINEGLKRCRAGQNDIVFVLPGHVENVAAADSWSSAVAGAQIIGVGVPGATNNPTITWTATAGTIALNDANVTISGLTLVWSGIDAVVTPMPVTAAGVSIIGCLIRAETATAGALKGVEVAVGGSGFRFVGNTMLSADITKLMTSAPVLVSGAADDVVVSDNYIASGNPGTSVLGLIAVTAAATNVRILRNTLIQLNTAGTALYGVTVGDVAATGVIGYNNLKTATNVTITTSLASQAGTAAQVGIAQFENRVCDATNTQGVLEPVVSS